MSHNTTFKKNNNGNYNPITIDYNYNPYTNKKSKEASCLTETLGTMFREISVQLLIILSSYLSLWSHY